MAVVSTRLFRLDCRLAGTSCTTPTMPTIIISVATASSTSVNPLCHRLLPDFTESKLFCRLTMISLMNYIVPQLPPADAVQDFAWPIGVNVMARYPPTLLVKPSEINQTDCAPPPQFV